MSKDNIAVVKLLGNLGKTPAGTRIGDEWVATPITLEQVISHIESKYGLSLTRDSMLVLVNGVEANALDELRTIVKSADEVVFVPMFHGGSMIRIS